MKILFIGITAVNSKSGSYSVGRSTPYRFLSGFIGRKKPRRHPLDAAAGSRSVLMFLSLFLPLFILCLFCLYLESLTAGE